MKKVRAILTIFCMIIMIGCTAQQRAKKYGGSSTIELPAGKKLVIATWKEDNLWLLYRDRKSSETTDTYSFKESSSWGVFEGVIVIKEK